MTLNRRTLLKAAPAFAGGSLTSLYTAQTRAATTTLRYGSSMPDTHPHVIRMREAADRIRRESNGSVDLQVFPQSQLGSDVDMLSQVRAGGLDFVTLSAVILSTLVPASAIHGVGFAWDSNEKVLAALDGELGAFVRERISKVGLHAHESIWDAGGFRQISSGTRPITTPEDLKGFKIRVPPGPLWISLFQALGAGPTSLNFAELYSALQTKVFDGQENALLTIETNKLFEVQKYISLTNHMWDGNWFLANSKLWASYPAEVRALVTKNVKQSALDSRKDTMAQTLLLEKAYPQRGIAVNTVAIAPFREKLQKAGFYQAWRGKFGEDAWKLLEKQTGPLT